jgi:adenylate cyclase
MAPPRRTLAAGLLALAGAVGLFALRPWVLERLELSLLDWRFRLRGPQPLSSPIVLVEIDEKSVDEIGRWPWRRNVLARLMDRLTDADVAAIGFDVVFSEPEVLPETPVLRQLRASAVRDGEGGGRFVALLDRAIEEADTDRRLAEAIARSGRTVLGYFFRTDRGASSDDAALRSALQRISGSRVAIARLPEGERAPVLECSGVEASLEPFAAAARRSGFFSSLRDRDGVVRRAPLVASCGGGLYVSLAVAIAETLLGERAAVLGDRWGIREIAIGGLRIPTDEGGRTIVDFRGPAKTFPGYAAVDVLSGRVGRSELRGKIALIGATEVGIGDIVATPFGSVFPGLEVHANVLDNLLSGSVLRRDDGLVAAELASMLVLGLALALLVPRLGSLARGALLATALLASLLVATFYAFAARGLWIHVTYPGLALVGVYGAVALAQAIAVEARARTIRRQFATYVPPEVVHEMVERPERFRLGTERRDLSVLFSDIRGFTSIAEEIGASDVSRLLNGYLTPMTRIVFESRGTLDKYIGDAIVAFWGAPLPVPDHPLRACESALAMQRALEDLRATRPDLPAVGRLRIGIGLHSGEVVVGNMGSELRFAYTVSGDGVNLCSRLEGLTRHYGVDVLASSDLVARLPGGFLCRELDSVRVKGRRGEVRIYEVLARPGEAHAGAGHLEAYARALELYREGRWRQAREALREVISLRGGADPPSELLLARIETLRGEPPARWDGAWTFEEK